MNLIQKYRSRLNTEPGAAVAELGVVAVAILAVGIAYSFVFRATQTIDEKAIIDSAASRAVPYARQDLVGISSGPGAVPDATIRETHSVSLANFIEANTEGRANCVGSFIVNAEAGCQAATIDPKLARVMNSSSGVCTGALAPEFNVGGAAYNAAEAFARAKCLPKQVLYAVRVASASNGQPVGDTIVVAGGGYEGTVGTATPIGGGGGGGGGIPTPTPTSTPTGTPVVQIPTPTPTSTPTNVPVMTPTPTPLGSSSQGTPSISPPWPVGHGGGQQGGGHVGQENSDSDVIIGDTWGDGGAHEGQGHQGKPGHQGGGF
jgi:hypothetical protein